MSSAKAEIRRLRDTVRSQSEQLDGQAATSLALEATAVKELAALKVKKTTLEDRYRALAAKYDACKEELADAHDALAAAHVAAPSPSPAKSRSSPSKSPPAGARWSRDARDGEPQAKPLLRCFDWVLVCITPPTAGSSML